MTGLATGGVENSISSPTTESSGLRVLGAVKEHYDIDIVLIPGVGTPAVETWPFASPRWLSQFLSLETSLTTRLLAFDYTFDLSDKLTWANVWEQGDRLLRELAKARRNVGSEDHKDFRPIIFVCHSLGGLILKQALCVAKEQLRRYESLINVVSGIIFQGTPHFRSHQLDKGIFILQAATKSKIKISSNKNDESLILSDLSARFEAIRIRCPILSIYETKETKVPQGILKSKRMILVDEKTSTIHAPLEQSLSIALDHIDLCRFHAKGNTDGAQSVIANFVCSVLDSAKSEIMSRMEAMEYRYAATTNYSPTISNESSVEINGENTRRDTSDNTPLNTANATHGSMTKSPSSQGHDVAILGTNFEHTETVGKVARLPCKMLDADLRNPSFFGQEEILQDIAQVLLPPKMEFISTISEPLRRFTLCGMGGMGKTELAIEFAFRYARAFDAIFFVSADETSKLDAQFSEIAVRLNLEETSESTNHVISRELVKGWMCNPLKEVTLEGSDLATAERASWLLVFDNADDPYTLADYWPIQGTGSMLITSRDPLAKSIFSTAPSGIDLEPMNKKEGGALLRKITNDQDQGGLSEEVSDLLGGFPLAITQMAGVIRRQELRLEEFMEIYKDRSEHSCLYELSFPLKHKVYPHTISTVWALQSLKPATKHLLQVLAFMDPDCIQESILKDPPAREEEHSTSIVPSHRDFRDARTELLQASLIKRNKNTEELRIHRLVQDVIFANMTTEDFKQTFWAMVNLLWSHWPTAFSPITRKGSTTTENLHLISRWPRCATLYPHVLRLKVIYTDQEHGVLGSANLKFASLLADAAWYQFERGRSRGFDGFWELALPACEQSSEEGKQSVLVDINFCMGAISMETNDRDGSRLHKTRALFLQKQTAEELDVIDLRLSRCYSEMSIAFIQDGAYDKGIEHILRSIEIDQKLGIYPKHWHAEANLGLAYTLKGDLHQAEKVLTGTLTRREEMFGYMDNKDYRLGRVLHAIGHLREVQGREDESSELHVRALSSFEATVGKRHHRVADLSHKVAQHLARREAYSEALEKCDEALRIWAYDESVYRREIARTTFLKHSILKRLGNDVKSRMLYKKASIMRQGLLQSISAENTELLESDFDALVSFWSQ